jgi:hypothetical protein
VQQKEIEMAQEFPIFYFETEKLMHKANQFADVYAVAFDDICAGKPGAEDAATKKCNQLRRAIRSALTAAYLEGCAEMAAEIQKR